MVRAVHSRKGLTDFSFAIYQGREDHRRGGNREKESEKGRDDGARNVRAGLPPFVQGRFYLPVFAIGDIIPLYNMRPIEGNSRLDHRLEGSSNRARALYASFKRLKAVGVTVVLCASNKVFS